MIAMSMDIAQIIKDLITVVVKMDSMVMAHSVRTLMNALQVSIVAITMLFVLTLRGN